MRMLVDAEDALLEILLELEECGEVAVYLSKQDDGKILAISAMDGRQLREVRNVLGKLSGFLSVDKPSVYFDKSEMMKLKLVK